MDDVAWYDARPNIRPSGDPELETPCTDVFYAFSMASLPLDGSTAEGTSAPAWLLVTGGVALGMGLAMGLVWALAGKTRGPGGGCAVPVRS